MCCLEYAIFFLLAHRSNFIGVFLELKLEFEIMVEILSEEARSMDVYTNKQIETPDLQDEMGNLETPRHSLSPLNFSK